VSENFVLRMATSRPFRIIARLIDLAEYYWTAWRSYCRILNWFPSSIDLSISLSTVFKYKENINIGNHVRIGPFVTLGAHSPIIIEDYVRISQGAFIETASLDISQKLHYPHVSKPINLKRGAWIGAGASILGGVTIGEQAIIGAGAVITKDVAAHAVVVGAGTRTLGPKHQRD
jgi:acetyltransferase-like isoleucine patch superfamily enzyme